MLHPDKLMESLKQYGAFSYSGSSPVEVIHAKFNRHWCREGIEDCRVLICSVFMLGHKPIFKEVLMSKVSSKRKVTLPIDLCVLAGIEPSDEASVFVDRRGIISVVKKIVGSFKGFLKARGRFTT